MGLSYGIGDRVMQIKDKVIGKVIDMYYHTACEQQTMILLDDGRKYHAPSSTFTRLSQFAIEAGIPAGPLMQQPLLITHDYRDIKITDDMTITIDVEEIKMQLEKNHYPEIGLNYVA